MIPALITLAARIGIPEPARKLAAWLALALGAAALVAAAIWAWNTWLDGERTDAVRAEQVKQQAASADARGRSAEERADDAIQDMIASQARETEIAKAAASEQAKPPEQRATLPPTTIALNCQRLRQAYTAAALAKMQAYQEKCR